MESTDTSTSAAGVGSTPAAAATAAPTLSRKELLEQYRRNKAAGNTSEGLQSKILSLKAGSVAGGTKRPVAARTPVTKTSIDRAKVQQAGERAVAPGTPVHALQKRLKLTSSSSAASTGRSAGAVPKSSSSLFGSTAASDMKKQPLSKAHTSDRGKVHRTALAPATTNIIAAEAGPIAMTAGPVKPVGSRATAPPAKAVLAKELVAWVEEANQLVKLGFVQAARALLEGLGPDPRTTGKALYWLARAKIEEEQGDWERASDLLEEGRSHITEKSGASSLDAVMMKEAIAEFKTRRTAAAVKEVDGLLDDSPQRQPCDHTNAARAVLPPPPPSALDMRDLKAPAPTPLAHDTNDDYVCITHDSSMSAAESPPGAVKGSDGGEREGRLDYGRIGKALETHMSALGLKSPAAKALRRMAESGVTTSIKDDAKDVDANGDSAAASEDGGSTTDATDSHRVFRAGHVSKLRQMFEKGALTGAVALPGMAQLNKGDRNSTSTDSSSSSPPLLSCSDLSKRLEDAQLDSGDGRCPRRESDGDAVLSRYLFDDSGDDAATVGASSEEEEDNIVNGARAKAGADGPAAHARVGRVLVRGEDTPARPKTATTPLLASSASRPMALSYPGLLSGGGARRFAVENQTLGHEAPHKLSEELSREESAPASAITGTLSFTARTGGASAVSKPPAGNTRMRAAVSFLESPAQAATTSSAFLMPPPPAKPLSCTSTTATTTKTTGTFTHASTPRTTRTGRARVAKRAPTPFKPPAAAPTDPHADSADVHTGTPDSDHTTSDGRAVLGEGSGVRGDGTGVAGGVRGGGGRALVGAYEQEGASGQRRATPMPSKRRPTNNKQVGADAAGGTYMTEVAMRSKDGALVTTPVRRSSRLTQTPTPTPIRRNIERMLATPDVSSMDSGGVKVSEK